MAGALWAVFTRCNGGQGRIGIDVTSAGAVLQLSCGVIRWWGYDLQMVTRIEVILVTPCAERLKCDTPPGCNLGVTSVASSTDNRGVVIAGIIWRAMQILDCRPQRRRMTGLAIQRGDEMSCRDAYSAGRCKATIVTLIAGHRRNQIVIKPRFSISPLLRPQ